LVEGRECDSEHKRPEQPNDAANVQLDVLAPDGVVTVCYFICYDDYLNCDYFRQLSMPKKVWTANLRNESIKHGHETI
jgi:N-acyl-D-aspartate/D-glutamate deacylase